MQIIDYKYLHGTNADKGYVAITELVRNKPATPQFIELMDLKIELTEPTAFVYIAGTQIDQSESGLNTGTGTYFPAIKSSTPYVAHQWASTFNNIELLVSMEVVNGTCASAIHAIYRAHEIIMDPINPAENVIIIGHERITQETMRLFKELGVKITCGDGFVYMKLSAGIDISIPKWLWAYNKNPFVFTKKTLNNLIPAYKVGYVKLHGTGTPCNNKAEQGLEDLSTPLYYKPMIGHTQGISALLETCILLDDENIRGRILVVANGLGGYYGSFTLTKPNART